MYKNQLQELAQRSCFGLPSYSCIREGPDHAPRFKATVNFNGETFESPAFFSTLRHAEHAAAEVALNMLAMKGPSRALTARVLDETGVYKNLLQETAHRAGLNLPTYNTVRTGPGHVPSFICTVELGGMTFVGQPSRTKKQAQKNAAMSAWSSLRKMATDRASSSSSTPSLESKACEEQEQAIVARFLTNLHPPNPKTKNKSIGHVPRCNNLYPVQNWTYSSFSPEMFVYNLLEEQKKILQQQQQMTTMMMLPYPRVFPVVHYPPESIQYFPVAPRISIDASRPYFSNQSASDPSCSRSTVTIQEILDEKTDEMAGQPSAESPRVVGPTPVSGSRPETRHPQTYAPPVRMRSTCDHSLPQTVRVVGPTPTPVSGSSPETRNPQTYAPVRMRTWGGSDPSFPRSVRVVGHAPVSSSRPETRHPQTYAPVRMRSFLAPPVRIRSVVPVCSAPPSTIPRQGRLEKKVNEVDEACSELGDLQL